MQAHRVVGPISVRQRVPVSLPELLGRLRAGVLLAACGPPVSVSEFTVEPSNICCGDSVHIHWSAGSDVTVALDPPATSPTSLPTGLEGDVDVVPSCVDAGTSDSVSVRLKTPSGTAVGEEKVIWTFRDGDVHRISTFGVCQSDNTVKWSDVRTPSDWSPRIVIRQVINDTGRPISVTHQSESSMTRETRSTALGSPGTTSEFNGLPVSGGWSFVVTPMPGETWCASGTTDAPVLDDIPTVRIQIVLGCA